MNTCEDHPRDHGDDVDIGKKDSNEEEEVKVVIEEESTTTTNNATNDSKIIISDEATIGEGQVLDSVVVVENNNNKHKDNDDVEENGGNGVRFFRRLKTARQKISLVANDAIVAATPAIHTARQAIMKQQQESSRATTAASASSHHSQPQRQPSLLDDDDDEEEEIDDSNHGSSRMGEDDERNDHNDSSSEYNNNNMKTTNDNDEGEEEDSITRCSSRTNPSPMSTEGASSFSTFQGRYYDSSQQPQQQQNFQSPARATNDLVGPAKKGVAATPQRALRAGRSFLQEAFQSTTQARQQQNNLNSVDLAAKDTLKKGDHAHHSRSSSTTSSSSHLITSSSRPNTGSGVPFSPPINVVQSSAGPHMEALLQKLDLEEDQHVLLLGHGLMGVNLKDCHHGGVYVDYLSPGGNADQSGMVAVGDRLIKVGDTSVEKRSILEVPQIIAKSRRPVMITLCRKHKNPPPVNEPYRYSPTDHALNAIIDIQQKVLRTIERDSADTAPAISTVISSEEDEDSEEDVVAESSNSNETKDDDGRTNDDVLSGDNEADKTITTATDDDAPVEATTTTTTMTTETTVSSATESDNAETTSSTAEEVNNGDVSFVSASDVIRPNKNDLVTPLKKAPVVPLTRASSSTSQKFPWTSPVGGPGGSGYKKNVKRSLAEYGTRRQYDMMCFAALKQALLDDEEENAEDDCPKRTSFTAKMNAGFKDICQDARCLPFLVSHLSQQDIYDAYGNSSSSGTHKMVDDGTGLNVSEIHSPKASIKLMLWLEMERYQELWPISTPERRLHHATRVVDKFLAVGNDDIHKEPSVGNTDGKAGQQHPFACSFFDSNLLDDVKCKLANATKEMEKKKKGEEAKGCADVDDDDCRDLPPRDLFENLMKALEQTLCGIVFASFLMSESFWRMRAFMANSPLAQHVTLEELWNSLNDNDSSSIVHRDHYLHYMLLHVMSTAESSTGASSSHAVATAVANTKGRASTSSTTATTKALASSSSSSSHVYAQLTTAIAIYKLWQFRHDAASMEHNTLYQQLWDIHLSPVTGNLTNHVPKESEDALAKARCALEQAIQEENDNKRNVVLNKHLKQLANELFWHYALNTYPKFKLDRLFDDYCREVERACAQRMAAMNDDDDDMSISDDQATPAELVTLSLRTTSGFPPCSPGFVSRVLRHDRLPVTISKHRSHRNTSSTTTTTGGTAERSISETAMESHSAEFAVVFGTTEDDEEEENGIRRLVATRVGDVPQSEAKPNMSASSFIPPRIQDVNHLPSTLEDYAASAGGASQERCIQSDDGWNIYLSNFTVPNPSPDFPNNWMYGVSLVLVEQQEEDLSTTEDGVRYHDHQAELGRREFHHPQNNIPSSSSPARGRYKAGLNMLRTKVVDRITFHHETATTPFAYSRSQSSPVLSSQPIDEKEHSSDSKPATTSRLSTTLGVALVSNDNTIPAMRESLHHFFLDMAVSSSTNDDKQHSTVVVARGLIDLFRTFSSSQKDNEEDAAAGTTIRTPDLTSILLPYLKKGSMNWVDRPLMDQRKYFEQYSVVQLTRCLPPMSLSLAFLTVLLEQKVVLVSRRQSMLLSASVALTSLLKPALQWHHLQVPVVATPSMTSDLIQYPAPFLIGVLLSSSYHGGDEEDILNSLPPDVTLVNLDLGQVTLATKYVGLHAQGTGVGRDTTAADHKTTVEPHDKRRTADLSYAVRSQMLHLAEHMGFWIGSKLCPVAWRCDDPFVLLSSSSSMTAQSRPATHSDHLNVLPKEEESVLSMRNGTETQMSMDDPSRSYVYTKLACIRLIRELVTGIPSCCACIEEKWQHVNHHDASTNKKTVECRSPKGETVILFDEKRFRDLKHLRSLRLGGGTSKKDSDEQDVAGTTNTKELGHFDSIDEEFVLNLNRHNLLIDIFLRGQGISHFVTSCSKQCMFYQ